MNPDEFDLKRIFGPGFYPENRKGRRAREANERRAIRAGILTKTETRLPYNGTEKEK